MVRFAEYRIRYVDGYQKTPSTTSFPRFIVVRAQRLVWISTTPWTKWRAWALRPNRREGPELPSYSLVTEAVGQEPALVTSWPFRPNISVRAFKIESGCNDHDILTTLRINDKRMPQPCICEHLTCIESFLSEAIVLFTVLSPKRNWRSNHDNYPRFLVDSWSSSSGSSTRRMTRVLA